MKKLFLSLIFSVLAIVLFAQTPTIVSTNPQNKHLVFEEYTGVNCGYCPAGHEWLNEMADYYPGTVVINIHQGVYAARYTTQWGNSLANQVASSGYPAFTMNRKTNNNCKIINYYSNDYNVSTEAYSLVNTTSPVNVAATAEIDFLTRVMTIHVEVYYTSDVTGQNGSSLNVALLQDYVKGPQANYGPYNQSQITEDGQYMHMHMLRNLITGQWGETIAANTEGTIPAGTFVSRDYTYTLPQTIGDVNVDIENMNLAVYVADLSQEGCSSLNSPNIYNGVKVMPTYTNIDSENATVNDVIFTDPLGCIDSVSVKAIIKNIGVPITSLELNCTNQLTNDSKTITVNENVATFATTTVDFGYILATLGTNNNYTITVTKINGVDYNGQTSVQGHTKKAISQTSGRPTLLLKTDKKGSEVTWFVYDINNNVIQQGGPYADGAIRKDTVVLNIPSDGCYLFSIVDAGGDGINNTKGTGNYSILNGAGEEMYRSNGKFGAGETIDFYASNIPAGINEANDNICQSILYPNPATNNTVLAINLGKSDRAKISVVDVMGREVLNLGEYNLNSGDNNININTTSLTNGVYFVRIVTNNGMVSNRLNISK